eukprot:TRINITY_DN1557_c0_g1_i3.p1 TRINITY_DN1557_c0_g1~~TRINITY_DN1557_c0_g1_i3.p1  ORF type:complete len:411 (+),score=108.79 TRINITY_DN1557_c0_g1_i3:63-1235(+)
MSKARKYLSNLTDLMGTFTTPHGKGKNCVGLVGIKSDCHSSYLAGCAEAPGKIREAFLCESANTWTEMGKNIVMHPFPAGDKKELSSLLESEARGEISSYNVIDLGDMEFSKEDERDPEGMFNSMVELCRLINAKNITPLFLGGDHSITYPLFVGLATTPKKHIGSIDVGDAKGGEWVETSDTDTLKPCIIHFDAHPDMYPDFGGNPYSHASPFARIAETELASKITQIGVRCGNAVQNNFIRDYPNIDQVPMNQLYAMTPADRTDMIVDAICWKGGSSISRPRTYISIDLDVLDPAYAPGLSHHEPGGISTRELLHMIQSIPHCAMLGADIVEYNPTRDRDNVTAMVAAKVMKELLPKLAIRDGFTAQQKIPSRKNKGVEWPWKRSERR